VVVTVCTVTGWSRGRRARRAVRFGDAYGDGRSGRRIPPPVGRAAVPLPDAGRAGRSLRGRSAAAAAGGRAPGRADRPDAPDGRAGAPSVQQVARAPLADGVADG